MRSVITLTILLSLILMNMVFASDFWDPVVDLKDGVAKGKVVVINRLVGTKSEGPVYLLQVDERAYYLLEKNADPWEPDENLEKFIGKFVEVRGEITKKVKPEKYETTLKAEIVLAVLIGWIEIDSIEELEGVECFHMIE